MELASRFAERPVFATGADGFVGSHLTEQLVEYGANVHVFVRATSSGELRNIRHLRDDITVHRGDLRDKHSVERAMRPLQEHSDAIVFHLGAQAHVGEWWERPYEAIDTNVVGTLNFFKTVVDPDLYEFDTMGTSREYGNVDHQMAYKREDVLCFALLQPRITRSHALDGRASEGARLGWTPFVLDETTVDLTGINRIWTADEHETVRPFGVVQWSDGVVQAFVEVNPSNMDFTMSGDWATVHAIAEHFVNTGVDFPLTFHATTHVPGRGDDRLYRVPSVGPGRSGLAGPPVALGGVP
jgi:hypothetical protein